MLHISNTDSHFSNSIVFNEIGYVRNNFKSPTDALELRKYESLLVIFPEFEEGLHKIEENEYLQILFNFHRENNSQLKDSTYDGKLRGIFSSRCCRRPNKIGLTTVRLLGKDGPILRVSGLDALDGSPILDIKPMCEVIDGKNGF
ncbi:MAG: tRNA-Thr(GGU) m(6)t(6)A37 methyltransferase TsaA [Promethearchaeota archaeon]|jgi:formylmethanofuran dehydrogenase subunit E|nr:MAG: tRNA-Thr(GGU) m(6)t(6)A37 methyltransferase TsaA [Candidatus Lokiarchaeota archaeon]